MPHTIGKEEMLCRTVALSHPDGVPSEIQVIPFGTHKTEKGDFTLDEEGSALILKDFESRANNMVIDYEHQTLGGSEAPAAGWIKKLINKGKDGIWAVVEWTDRAKQYLKNREYRYLSPVFLKKGSDNKVIQLINAGLTNQPAIDGMVPLVNKGGDSPPYRKEEKVMKKLLELLGLKEDATASEVTATILAMKQAQGQASEVPVLKSELQALKAQIANRDAEELVALAMKEGKVTPAQKDWAVAYAGRDPEGFKVFVAKVPVVVHTGETAGGKGPGDGVSISEVQTQINKALGVSEEMFKKHNKEV